MSSYNNTIVQKLAAYIENVVETIGPKDELGRSVVLSNYKMVASDNIEINTLMTCRMTSVFTVIFDFNILDANNQLIKTQSTELYIPKMVNNIFIIDGTPRIPTQTLDNDWVCRIHKQNILVNDCINIPYSVEEDGSMSYYVDAWDPMLDNTYQITQAMDWDAPEIKRLLKLNSLEKLKFQVKLDVDQIGDYITKELVESLIKLGPDISRDSIIDKCITTTETDLINSLYKRKIRKNILTNIAKKFFQYENIYLTDIQNAIDRYFKVADDQTIDIPATVNPLVYDALKYKITVPKHVAYNSSFSDLIDPVNTPENNNVNRINELNVCTSIDDGTIYIVCYDLSGNKVKLPYLEYINKPVLSNMDYDYQTKSVIKKDSYQVKLRLRTKQVTDLSEYADLLVEPKPDEKLSVTTRRIPMVNVSDSVRVAMGSSMSKQAIEVECSEPALIVSGNDDEDVVNSSLITRYHGSPGKVEKIKGNRIFIKDAQGSLTYVDVSQPTIGANDSVISFEPNVVEGQALSDGDIVIAPKVLMNNSYELGVNARAFYMNYLGWSHEDGIIISESFAKKLHSYAIVDVSIHVRGNDIIKYLRKKGSKVQSGDVLVNCVTPLKGSRTTNQIFDPSTGMLGFTDFTKNSNNLEVPNNVDLGYVVDVLIQESPIADNKTQSEVTLETINKFIEDKEVMSDWDILPTKYRELKCTDGELFNNDSYLITYKLIKYRPAIRGSKLCNRYGSKGEVSLILPDHLMPRLDEDGQGNGTPADIILNPAAVIARKNPSQLYEALLTKVIKAIYKKISSLTQVNEVQKAKDFTQKYYGDYYSLMTDEEFLDKVRGGVTNFRIAVGSFMKVSYDTVMNWAKELNVTETDLIYCPDIITQDGLDGLRAFDPEVTDISSIPNGKLHELGFIEAPVITGDTYIMKLYHSADYVGKATPTQLDADEPYMTRGLYRTGGGQKLGEMELWALLSYGTEDFIRQGSENMLTSQYEFLNELLLAGYAMVDGEGLPLLSDYRSKVNRQLKE